MLALLWAYSGCELCNSLHSCHIQHAHQINFKGDDILMLRDCYTAPSWPKQSSTAALNYCEKILWTKSDLMYFTSFHSFAMFSYLSNCIGDYSVIMEIVAKTTKITPSCNKCELSINPEVMVMVHIGLLYGCTYPQLA